MFILGSKVYDALVRLIATLLILKRITLMPCHNFPIVFTPKISILQEDAISPAKFIQALKKAVQFSSSMDKRFPKLYSRLELGRNWDEVVDKLGFP